MIGILARRTLTDRPRRTVLLLLGFGISVGVMTVLLSIGQAVLDQARDKSVVGGGDLVVVPEGIDVEVMQVGGATGMFFSIDNARFVYRQVLSGPRFAPQLASVAAPAAASEPPLAAASPTLSGKLVYVRKARSKTPPQRAVAHGVIPSLERAVQSGPVRNDGSSIHWSDAVSDRLWMDPPVDSLYAAMDRFHVPPAGRNDLDRWAEWLYFNFNDPTTDTVGFLSFIVTGDIAAGRGRALPLLQLLRSDATPERFQGGLPLAADDVSTARCELRFGAATQVTFESGAWHLLLNWDSPEGPVHGALRVVPEPDLYYPPFLIHEGETLVSGYTVPALRARMDGWIEVGGRRLELRDAPAYHDHNWGTWHNVRWEWGTAAVDSFGVFYGRVEHPDLQRGAATAGVFAMLLQARQPNCRGGFLGLFRPDSIAYSWHETASDFAERPHRVPSSLAMVAQSSTGDRFAVQARIASVVPTAPRTGEAPFTFLQMRGPFTIEARIANRPIRFETLGFAETFVP